MHQNYLAGLLPQTVGLEVPLRVLESLCSVFLQRPVFDAFDNGACFAFRCDDSKARAPQPALDPFNSFGTTFHDHGERAPTVHHKLHQHAAGSRTVSLFLVPSRLARTSEPHLIDETFQDLLWFRLVPGTRRDEGIVRPVYTTVHVSV